MPEPSKEAEKIKAIREAIRTHNFIQFDYVKKKTLEITRERLLDIVDTDGLMVWGRDLKKRELRRFEIEGMQQVKVIDRF